jgi:hypothetical protein
MIQLKAHLRPQKSPIFSGLSAATGRLAAYRYLTRGGTDPDNPRYVPTAWPGARLPHAWLANGTAMHDRLGAGFTLLRLGGTSPIACRSRTPY